MFAVNKFYCYFHDHQFLLLADHKPLFFTFKPKERVPIYASAPDALSCLITESSESDEIVISNVDVEIVVEAEETCDKLSLTNRDIVQDTDKNRLLEELYHRKNELSEINGTLLYENRVIIPTSFQKKLFLELKMDLNSSSSCASTGTMNQTGLLEQLYVTIELPFIM
uniref:RT_RNaseH domain-containing protein n=1 Tax=Heterorhabditis bacteriophora TaxID=37862 RepID=A0A1I7X3E6_HETBA